MGQQDVLDTIISRDEVSLISEHCILNSFHFGVTLGLSLRCIGLDRLLERLLDLHGNGVRTNVQTRNVGRYDISRFWRQNVASCFMGRSGNLKINLN